MGHFWPFSDHFSDFFKFWENGHFLYALDFLGGPGTINRQKIEICLRYFAGSLEPSKTIYLLKISSFQAFLVILWDFYKFWKISDFWGFCPRREHFESSKTHILAKNQNFQKRLNRALDNHIGYLYMQSELYWSIAPGVYRLLVNTQISSFWAIFGNFGSVHGIFSDSRTKNRWKIKIFKICSIGFLIIIITNHKPKIRSIGSFLVSFIDFEWTHYCSKWANFRLFLYIKCLQVHKLKVV